LLDIDVKIILLDRQNNFETLKIMSNAAKNFDILATSLSVLHNYLLVQQNHFSDLCPVKIVDLSAKPFTFSCNLIKIMNKFLHLECIITSYDLTASRCCWTCERAIFTRRE